MFPANYLGMLCSFRTAGLLGSLLLTASLSPTAHTHSSPADAALFKPAYIKAQLLKTTQWQLAHPKHKVTD